MSDFDIKYKEFYTWFDNRYGVSKIASSVAIILNKRWTIKHLLERIRELVNLFTVFVATLENFSRDVKSLEDSEKLDIAVEFLDSIITLPIYLEFIDVLIKDCSFLASSKAKTLFKWGEPVTVATFTDHINKVTDEVNV